MPIAVTALGGDELSVSNIDGQQALPKLTPNMNLTVIESFASVYIRGVGTQYTNPDMERSVSDYLDDTYLPRAKNGMFTIGDIARIEVLKGPQGTLCGRSATGGAIRFAARHGERDGFVRNLAPGALQSTLGNRNEELYLAKLLIEATPEFTIKLSGDYSHKKDSEGHNFINLYPNAPEQIGLALCGCGRTDKFNTICNDGNASLGSQRRIGPNIKSYGGRLRLDYDIGRATISSITAYRETKEDNKADLDSTGFPIEAFSVRTPMPLV